MPTALEPDVIRRLQDAIWILLRRIDSAKPEHAQSKLAPRLKIDRSQISRILKHGTGGSLRLIRAVAEQLNWTPERILNGEHGRAEVRQARELPGYADALADVKARILRGEVQLTDEDLERAGDFRGEPEPLLIDPMYIAAVAVTLRRAKTKAPTSKTQRAAKRIS